MIARWAGVETNYVGEAIIAVAEYYPDKHKLYVTSGMDGDHGPSSYHYANLPYSGQPTAAIDFGAGGLTAAGSANMRDFARWCYTTFPEECIELIHTTPYSDDLGFYVRYGVQRPGFDYGGTNPDGTSAHLNHVHLAMSYLGARRVLARLAAAVPPVPTTDFTSAQAVHFEALCWRIDALIGDKPSVAGGPTKGELNRFGGR